MGIDLAEQSTFGHLHDRWVRQAAARWLRPGELAWCAAQPSYREALVVVLSCKEAVYKAWRTTGEAHEVSLALRGATRAGWADCACPGRVKVRAAWHVADGLVASLAVAIGVA